MKSFESEPGRRRLKKHLTAGEGGALATLRRVCETHRVASLAGLGQHMYHMGSSDTISDQPAPAASGGATAAQGKSSRGDPRAECLRGLLESTSYLHPLGAVRADPGAGRHPGIWGGGSVGPISTRVAFICQRAIARKSREVALPENWQNKVKLGRAIPLRKPHTGWCSNGQRPWAKPGCKAHQSMQSSFEMWLEGLGHVKQATNSGGETSPRRYCGPRPISPSALAGRSGRPAALPRCLHCCDRRETCRTVRKECGEERGAPDRSCSQRPAGSLPREKADGEARKIIANIPCEIGIWGRVC